MRMISVLVFGGVFFGYLALPSFGLDYIIDRRFDLPIGSGNAPEWNRDDALSYDAVTGEVIYHVASENQGKNAWSQYWWPPDLASASGALIQEGHSGSVPLINPPAPFYVSPIMINKQVEGDANAFMLHYDGYATWPTWPQPDWFQPWGLEDAPTSWSFGQILPTGLSKSFIESDLYAFPDMQLIYLELPGDFNQDAILNAPDIDRLSTSIRTGQHELRFDLNENGLIEPKDRDTWVHNLAQTHYGDADVDGTFDSSDLVSVMVAGQYEDDLALNSTWSTGDWNGDGEFDSSDLVLAFEDGGYAKAATAAKAVPEPRSFAVFAIVIPLLVRRFRL